MERVLRFNRSDKGASAVVCAVLVGLAVLAAITAIMVYAQMTAGTAPEPYPTVRTSAPSDG